MRECESRSSGFRGLIDHKSGFTTGDKRIFMRTEQRATNSYFNAGGIGASDAMIRPVIPRSAGLGPNTQDSPTLKCFEKVCPVDGGGGWSII